MIVDMEYQQRLCFIYEYQLWLDAPLLLEKIDKLMLGLELLPNSQKQLPSNWLLHVRVMEKGTITTISKDLEFTASDNEHQLSQ